MQLRKTSEKKTDKGIQIYFLMRVHESEIPVHVKRVPWGLSYFQNKYMVNKCKTL